MTPIERYAYQTGRYNKHSNFSFAPTSELDKYIIATVETRRGNRGIIDTRRLEKQKQAFAKDCKKAVEKELKDLVKNFK